MIGLIGHNGSGKSTLMAIIAGLEPPSRGKVSVAGHDLHHMGEDALALFRRDHVGIVFQSFHLIPTMMALENVAMPLEFAGRRDAGRCECPRDVLRTHLRPGGGKPRITPNAKTSGACHVLRDRWPSLTTASLPLWSLSDRRCASACSTRRM